jgi:hypothetical protein
MESADFNPKSVATEASIDDSSLPVSSRTTRSRSWILTGTKTVSLMTSIAMDSCALTQRGATSERNRTDVRQKSFTAPRGNLGRNLLQFASSETHRHVDFLDGSQ